MLRLFFVFLIPVFAFCDDIVLGPASVSLAVDTAIAGDNPLPEFDSLSSYQITNVDVSPGNRVIRVNIDSALPTGATLSMAAEAPGTGTSTGLQTVPVTPSTVNLVTDIVPGSIVTNTDFSLTLSIACTAAVLPQVFSRTITVEIIVP